MDNILMNILRKVNQEQRNKLARQLFNEIGVKDKQVTAIKPRLEIPFSPISYYKAASVITISLKSVKAL